LRSHITQLGKQITGISAQLKSRGTEVDLIAGELKGVQTLYDKKLVPLTRLASLQREAARLEGERGQLLSATAEAESKISEAELQIARIDHDFRTEVSKDLREAQDKEAELAERVVVAKDQLAHTDIRAPSSGFVHQLAAHTIGGVITPGEVIMELVPNSDELLIEAHIQPKDIDHVAEGQKALVRLSAFNQRTTPELSGIVSYVSADLTHEKQNAAPDYIVRVMLSGSEIHRLGNVQLVSGMPAELFLQTGSRTIIGMLLKPITDQLHRTFSDP
ncbi:MAG: HlyD family secretion protein, partial [Hyphomicrobiales bacterium]|nr:HlyD family secretion protein [Hyphomicrobiales bacterium]